MAFRDEDLRDEVEGLFEEVQATFEGDAKREMIYGSTGRDTKGGVGSGFADPGTSKAHPGFQRSFRIFQPNPAKTEYRKAAMRRFEAKYANEALKVRILAGERPKLGGRGRPPTRWFKAAAELGIDLRAEANGVTLPSAASSQAAE